MSTKFLTTYLDFSIIIFVYISFQRESIIHVVVDEESDYK